jgi:hypothetical protein
MKKVLLTFMMGLFLTISSIAQSYIGQTYNYIQSDIYNSNPNGISSTSYENDALTVNFTDNHSAVYIFDAKTQGCMYYFLLYNTSSISLTSIENMLNSVGDHIGFHKRYTLLGEYYIYWMLTIESDGGLYVISVYPSFFESDIQSYLDLI